MKKVSTEQQRAVNGGARGVKGRTYLWYAGEVVGIGAMIAGGPIAAGIVGIGCGIGALGSMINKR